MLRQYLIVGANVSLDMMEMVSLALMLMNAPVRTLVTRELTDLPALTLSVVTNAHASQDTPCPSPPRVRSVTT